MGRTALYRDATWHPPRAAVSLDPDVVQLDHADGRRLRHSLDGFTPTALDGFVAHQDLGRHRRFVRMLVLEKRAARHVFITPPEQGAVAPNVISVPEAPTEAAILETLAFEALSDWILRGGRLGAFSISDLARLAQIASASFAVVIGEVAAQRAIEIAWDARGPLRSYGAAPEASLQPLADAAKTSPRAAEALVSALAHLAGRLRRRRW